MIAPWAGVFTADDDHVLARLSYNGEIILSACDGDATVELPLTPEQARTLAALLVHLSDERENVERG